MFQENLQHVRIPNQSTNPKEAFTLNSVMVYAYLRAYMNNETKKCHPSIKTLSLDTGLAIETVKKALKLMESQGLITMEKHEKSYEYTFTDECLQQFEPFTFEFLKQIDLPSKLKGYWLLLQRFTFKDELSGMAKTSYTNKEIAELLNISENSVKRYNKQLTDRGVLTSTKTTYKDPESGVKIVMKNYDLAPLGQVNLFIKKLVEHDEKLEMQGEKLEMHINEQFKYNQEVKESIQTLKDIIEQQRKDLIELKGKQELIIT